MSTLLQQLQNHGGGAKNAVNPFRRQPSLLFDDVTARTVTLEQFHDIGLKGLHGLIQLNTSFSSYQNTVFKESFMKIDREVASKEYNEAINEAIRIFLNLLSPYFLYTHAHYCLEYLLQVFHIHQHSAEELLRCVLPFHEHVLFVRVLQLIPLHKIPLWSFLEENCQSGTPLDMALLVDKSLINPNVLVVASQIVDSSATQNSLSNTLLAFWTRLTTRLIARKSMGETHIRIILTVVKKGLFSANEDWLSSSLLIVMSLVNHITMTQTLLEDLTELLCAKLRNVLEQGSGQAALTLQNSSMYTLFYTLIYLIGHAGQNGGKFSEDLKSKWWCTLSAFMKAGSNAEVLVTLKEELSQKGYACDLFNLAIESMISPSTMCSESNVWILEEFIKTGIIKLSSTGENTDGLFCIICDSSFAALQNSSLPKDSIAENANTHPSLKMLSFLRNNYARIFERHIEKLKADNSQENILDDSVLDRVSSHSKATSSQLLVPDSDMGEWDGDMSPAELIALFSHDFFLQSDDLQGDSIVPLLNRQRAALEKVIQSKTSNKLDWAFIASAVGEWYYMGLMKISNRCYNEKGASLLLHFWNAFSLANANISPFVAHQDSVTTYKNICTAVRLTCNLLRLIAIETSNGESLPDDVQLLGAEFLTVFPLSEKVYSDHSCRSVVNQVASCFSKLFQPTMMELLAVTHETFKGLYGVDKAMAHFLLFHFIRHSSGECVSKEKQATLVTIFCDFYVKGHLSVDFSSATTWRDLIIDGCIGESHNTSKASPDGTEKSDAALLWHFSFMQLLKLNDSFWLSKKVANQVCEIYAEQRVANTKPTFLHDVIRAVVSGPSSHSISWLVDGILVHRPRAQQLQSIVSEITSYFCANVHELSEVESSRILLLFVVGTHQQLQVKSLDCSDSVYDDLISQQKSAVDGEKRSLLDFVATVLGTLPKGETFSLNDEEKVVFRQVFDRLHKYILNELSHSLSEAQKAILLHSYYTMAKFFIAIYSNEESVALFLLKTQSQEKKTDDNDMRALLSASFTKLHTAILPSPVPCELMLHQVLSANYDSVEEITAVIHSLKVFAQNRSVYRARCFLDEYCPQEYPDISVNNLILVAYHTILQKQADLTLTGDTFTELVELFLLVRPSAVTASSTMFERKFQSFSWEYLWRNYASQLLRLCLRQLRTIICRETIVLILEAIHSGIPYVSESEISEFDRIREFVIADLHHITARMCAKASDEHEIAADDKKIAMLNSSAEIEMLILRDLGMDSDESEKVAWSFFHSSRSSRQVERLSMELLMARWKLETVVSAEKSQDLNVLECCRKADSMFVMLTKNTSFPSRSLNVVLSHLGGLLGDVIASKNNHKVATSFDFLQKILRSGCFPFPMNNVIFLACLSYAHENHGTSAIVDILHNCMLELSREDICQQMSSLLQICDALSERFSNKKSRKRDRSDDSCGSSTFVRFMSQFFVSLLSTFGQKIGAAHREIAQCELRLIADSCSRYARNDDFLVQLGKIFSANEVVCACEHLLKKSFAVDINTFSWFFQISLTENQAVIDDELFHSLYLALYKKLQSDSDNHPAASWMNEYHSILGMMSALFQYSSNVNLVDTAELNMEKEVLPNFDCYFHELTKQHEAAVEPLSQRRSIDLLCMCLRVMSCVFHSLPEHEQIRYINWYCSVLFRRAITDSIVTSDILVRTILGIVSRLFGSSDIITGTVCTVSIYSDLLYTLAYCSANTSNDALEDTDQPHITELLEAISVKLDTSVLFQGFERKCKDLMQRTANFESLPVVDPQTVVHQAACIVMTIVRCKLQGTSCFERKELDMWIKCLQRFHHATMAFTFHQTTELEITTRTSIVFFQKTSENIINFILLVMSKTKNSVKQTLLTKIIGFLDAGQLAEQLAHSPVDKQQSAFCQFSIRSLILSNLCNRMLREFSEFGVKFFYHCEDSLKRLLRFAERNDWPWYTPFRPIVEGILEGSLGKSSSGYLSNAEFIMSMVGEIIVITADSIEYISEIPTGGQWIDNSCAQGIESTLYHVTQIYCNPIWQKFCVSVFLPPLTSLERHMVKNHNRKIGETITETLHKILGEDTDVVKRAKVVQDALLQGISENPVVNSIENTRLRVQVFDALRCETICIIERIYKTVGPPMNVLLRDVLVHFTKFMDDKNPVVKSLARKALHSMAEAVGLSIEMVMGAL